MSTTLRNVLLLAGTAVLPLAASAATIATSYDYTYTINLSGGAAFVLHQNGPLGDPGTSSTGWAYVGSPNAAAGYVPPGDSVFSTTGDNGQDGAASWTELAIEWIQPSSPGSNTASSYYAYTLTALDSFWASPGTAQMFPDDGTMYEGITYSIENVDGSNPPGGGLQFGQIEQGAYYGLYSNPNNSGMSDPPCSSCTITTVVTPVSTNVTPEPSTMTLFATGSAALLGVYRRRRRLL